MINILHKNKRDLKTGFSLIESLVAISILIIGVLSAFILVIRSLSSTPLIQGRLIASNLGQEGIELIRQIRDTNFINSRSWRTNLDSGEYQIDGLNKILEKFDASMFLKFDDANLIYNYENGNNFPYFFQRKIIISNGNSANEMKLNVIVTWCVKKGETQCLQNPTYKINIEDHLYNYFVESR